MLGDDLLEHVPDLGRHRVHVLLRRLDVLHGLAVDEPAHDERLEELERHDLGQAALVELQVRPGDDHRAARVVHALAEQVLAEAALLALEHVRERLERPVARARHRTPAAAVVEQRVDGLLEHALLVVDDDLGRAQVEQPLQAVVPIDDTPVQVVQVARGEPAAVQLHHRAQLRRDHRDGLEDHPLRLVLRLDERVDDLQALDRALALLTLGGLDRLAERRGLGIEVEVLEQLADRLRAHPAREVDVEAVRRAEAVLQLAEQLLVADDLLRLELLEELPRVGEALLGVLGRLVGVLAPRVDVEVHLAHLQRPLDDGVEILLLDLPVRAQAEVVRELADLVRARIRLGLFQDLAQEALAQVARLLELLFVNARDELLVVLVDLRLLDEEAVEHAVDVLRDGALLGAGRLGQLLVEALERLADLDRHGRDRLQFPRRQPAVVADGCGANELADLLGVLGRDLVRDVEEQLGDELPRLFERRDCLLLGPVGQAADPELVVLVEVPLGALREVVPAPLQPVLERGESLVAVDVDLLLLGLDLALEVVQVLLALGDVDRGHDRSREVEDLLELARGDVEQVADPAGNALEEPDVRDGGGQVDVAHALAAHLLAGHLDAAALADDALVADSLVLAAVALPVLRRTEDALAEETVALGLERAVVDRLGLRDLAGRPVANLLRRREADSDRVEIVDVDQVRCFSALFRGFCGCLFRYLDFGEVGQRLVGRERQLTVLVDALLSLLGLLGGRLTRRCAERSR